MGRVGTSIILLIILGLVVSSLVFTFFKERERRDGNVKPTAQSAQLNVDIAQLRTSLSEQIEAIGPENAYLHFKSLYKERGYGEQHGAMHIFGDLLYEKMGIAGLSICDDAYQFGCAHAFMGRAISEGGLSILSRLDKVCSGMALSKNKGDGVCKHGIGHGVLVYFGENNLLEALNSCSTLSWESPLGGCPSGVFMEYNFSTTADPYSSGILARQIDSHNPYEPCSSIPKKFRQACYFEQAHWWATVFREDYKKIGTLCANISDYQERDACFRGAGSTIASHNSYVPETTITNCHEMPSQDALNMCITGAAAISAAISGDRLSASKFCDGLKREKQKTCLEEIDSLLKNK